MKVPLIAWASMLIFVSTSVRAEPVPLELLLSDTQNAVSILQAESALEGARHELQRDSGQKGWQLTGALGYGLIRNIVDENRAISYPASQAQLGFSYPLLGASEQRQRAVDLDNGKVREKEVRLEEARHRAPLELESNYARYWGAQEAIIVLDAYLASESTLTQRLRMRQQKKLMLESKMIDLLSSYASARSDRAQLLRVREQTRSRLTLLTGRQLTELIARPVALPAVPDGVSKDAFARHPDLVALAAQSDALQAQLGNSSWYGMDAAFNVMAAANNDQRDHQTGGTAFVGFNFSAPISLFSVRREERQRLQSAIHAVQLQQRQRTEELNVEARTALDRLTQANEEMDIATQKTQAAAAAVRERQLRSNVFSEEGIEALTQQLRDYTIQAVADIDAQVKVWQANIEARGYLQAGADNIVIPKSVDSTLGTQLAEPLSVIAGKLQGNSGQATPRTESGMADTPTMKAAMKSVAIQQKVPADTFSADKASKAYRMIALPQRRAARLRQVSWHPTAALTSASSVQTAPDMAVYVWNSKDLIEKNQFQPTFWNLLDRLSIRRLLLSLNAGQIRDAKAHPQSLRDFLDNAKSKGVAVELLLGEPSWIEPSKRQNLIDLINSLRGFDFAGLHLDIEPDQLYKQPLKHTQFDAWVQTLQAAAKASPWPTAVSIHPRYFRDAPYRDWQLAKLLHDGGVHEIALMIFSSDTSKVAAVARPILADTPEMNFRIAQSVEPQLDPALSHARRRPEEFEAAMRDLQQKLSTQANADGVAVQAWADLMRMGYESQIH